MSLPVAQLKPASDRREQILDAAMVCFAQRGFHQTTMQHISAFAGISVGLIYRYFENKDAVIAAMADQHKAALESVLTRAADAPSLLEALQIFFTDHCCSEQPIETIGAFVMDLFAEAARNPNVAAIVRDVVEYSTAGLAGLIAKSPESARLPKDFTPRRLAELILAVHDGTVMRDVVSPQSIPSSELQAAQCEVVRDLCRLIFGKGG